MPRKQSKKSKSVPERHIASPQADLQVSALSLHALQFARLGSRSDIRTVDCETTLGTAFISPSSLGVELNLKTRCDDAFEATISYRAVFNRTVPFSANEDEETFWRSVIAHVSPVVLMPYIRATFSWLVAQAGFPSIVLPLVNPQQLVSLEDIVLPVKMRQP